MFVLQVYYFRQGHELYVKEVMATKCYDINPKKQCFYKLRLKVSSWVTKLVIVRDRGWIFITLRKELQGRMSLQPSSLRCYSGE